MADRLGVSIAEHLVATTRGGDRSLIWPERARWLWDRLRANLPEALSNLVMPDHLHMVAGPGMRPRLRRVLSSFTVRFGVQFDVLEPQVASSPAIAGRMICYGFFNPVRAGLLDDPLAWPWSTLRDLVGAVAQTWTPIGRVASVLGLRADACVRALTSLGEHRSAPLRAGPIGAASWDAVQDAVMSALRLSDVAEILEPRPRRLFVQACYAVGKPHQLALAERLDCSERSIRRDRAGRDAALDAVLRCLGDARLRVHALSRLGG